jgi:hypothetical protein
MVSFNKLFIGKLVIAAIGLIMAGVLNAAGQDLWQWVRVLLER